MRKVSLSKYNVPIKERTKVTSAPNPERVAPSTKVEHSLDGRIVVIRNADSSAVQEAARKVIEKHHEVIKRLAKR